MKSSRDDMPQIVPSNRAILGGNKALHRESRQHMVLLRFRRPISMHFAWEFLRVRLGQSRLARGEADNTATLVSRELASASSLKSFACPRCEQPAVKVGLQQWSCANRACPLIGRTIDLASPRGVVNVIIPQDQIVDVGMITACVLVLDRRYPEDVLASVYRAAATLCDMMGWELK